MKIGKSMTKEEFEEYLKTNPILETSILYNLQQGIHKVTKYYADGRVEKSEERRSPILIIPALTIY